METTLGVMPCAFDDDEPICIDLSNVVIIKKGGNKQKFNGDKIRIAISKSAERVDYVLSYEQKNSVVKTVAEAVDAMSCPEIPVETVHHLVENALDLVAPKVAKSYRDYRNYKKETSQLWDEVLAESNRIQFLGDKENSNSDSTLVSTKRTLTCNVLNERLYVKYFLTDSEREAQADGYIYIHDKSARRDTMNCCLFDLKAVMSGGFEMSNMWYNEPKTIRTAFSVIGDITLMSASQQYGGFTLPELDDTLTPYAEKSYNKYMSYCERYGIEKAEQFCHDMVIKDIEQGYQGLEYKFNTVASSRGDYPFITITCGHSTSYWGKEIAKAIMRVHRNGQGAPGHKKAVLFPKIVFLYDKDLHEDGCECIDVFEEGIECSAKTMYPDWLSLTGDGYVASIYKKYGRIISPMGCRAFLSPWYERGGMKPADENDMPVFIGRFNIGAVSLNLPMILAKARDENKDFYEVLDYYMEMIRHIHIRTYNYLSKLKASMNPLGFCAGGFYGGHLHHNDYIEPVLSSSTASFGITALNELQRLYNGKSIREDGKFALEVMEYINNKVNEFKEADHYLYAIYGTPAESLCGKQVKQFRAKYGIVKNVSDREYVSNSFHCHVSEDMSPIEKQDKEARFWNLLNGGKIQYVKYPVGYNKEAIKVLVRRAMKMGLYEGVNLALSYCDDCGHEELNMTTECPVCHSRNLTKIDRMNGYLSYSRVKGDTRLNEAKMKEIEDRVSM